MPHSLNIHYRPTSGNHNQGKLLHQLDKKKMNI